MKLGDHILATLAPILWRCLAFVVSRRWVTRLIIAKAMRTPYFHLHGYMDRFWLFNGYEECRGDLSDAQRQEAKRFPQLPSIRVHHILREDLAKHPHDHPWDFRTIILDDWYIERRENAPARVLRRGDTASINFGEYHHIERVAEGGVWTMVIIFDYRGKWGFNVDGKKMSPKLYAIRYPERDTRLQEQERRVA